MRPSSFSTRPPNVRTSVSSSLTRSGNISSTSLRGIPPSTMVSPPRRSTSSSTSSNSSRISPPPRQRVAGVLLAAHDREVLGNRLVHEEAHHVHPRGHDLRHLALRKVDHVLQQAPFGGVEYAVGVARSPDPPQLFRGGRLLRF